MNRQLRREISFLMAIGTIALLYNRKYRTAGALGASALALRAWPGKRASFKGQTAIITGGSRGLGFALAEELVKEGANVTLLARDPEELSRATARLKQIPGARILALMCDVTDHEQLDDAFNETEEQFGSIDLLVNNAGAIAAGPLESMNQSDYVAQVNLHLMAVVKATELIVPIFKRQGGGRIINISSLGGKMPVPHMATYCASKFALSGFSQTTAIELAHMNIHVTTVYPGLMRTGSPIQAVFKGDFQREYAWFALSSATPGLTISASRAARMILKAAKDGRTEIILSMPAKAGIWLHTRFPEIFRVLMAGVNRLLPHDSSTESHTGAASADWFNRRLWSAPFRAILSNAKQRYNQQEKYDARFNLNLQSRH